jgi:hypothetical protein
VPEINLNKFSKGKQVNVDRRKTLPPIFVLLITLSLGIFLVLARAPGVYGFVPPTALVLNSSTCSSFFDGFWYGNVAPPAVPSFYVCQVGCLSLAEGGSSCTSGTYTISSNTEFTIPSDWILDMESSTLSVVGSMDVYGTLTGYVWLAGSVLNYGTTTIESGGKLFDSNVVSDFGTMYNLGVITGGGVPAYDTKITFTIGTSGSLVNQGAIENYFKFFNLGSSTNECEGTFTEESDGTYTGSFAGNPITTATCTTIGSTFPTPVFPLGSVLAVLVPLGALALFFVYGRMNTKKSIVNSLPK